MADLVGRGSINVPIISHLKHIPDAAVTKEEAARAINALDSALNNIETAKIAAKLIRGAYFHSQTPEGRSEYGAGTLTAVRDAVRDTYGSCPSDTVLYEERSMYRAVDALYGDDWQRFSDWVAEKSRNIGRPPTWGFLKEEFLEGKSDKEVLGSEERARRRQFYKAERALLEIDNMVELAEQGDEEAAGFVVMAIESMAALARRNEKAKLKRIPGTGMAIDKDYEIFIKSLPCWHTGSEPAVGCHIFSGVTARKKSSVTMVPMADEIHKQQHQMGIQSFSKKMAGEMGYTDDNWHTLIWYRLMVNYLSMYFYGSFFDMELPT